MAKASVLIVEDEPQVRVLLETLLSAWGFQCISADCVSDAVAAFEKLRVTEGLKIILLDWLIPQGRVDLGRARSLEARKSELQSRLSSPSGEKPGEGELKELRRKMNDLDDEIERMLRSKSGIFLDIVKDELDGVGVIVHSGTLLQDPPDIKNLWVLAKPIEVRRLRDTLQECCERLTESSGRSSD